MEARRQMASGAISNIMIISWDFLYGSWFLSALTSLHFDIPSRPTLNPPTPMARMHTTWLFFNFASDSPLMGSTSEIVYPRANGVARHPASQRIQFTVLELFIRKILLNTKKAHREESERANYLIFNEILSKIFIHLWAQQRRGEWMNLQGSRILIFREI